MIALAERAAKAVEVCLPVAFGPPLPQSGPSSLQPVAPHGPPPLAAKVRQVLCGIRFGFGALDSVLCDHPEVVDEGRSRHPSGDLGPLCPPEEVCILAAPVAEPFIKQPDRVKHIPPDQHAGPHQPGPSRRPAGRREFGSIFVQLVIEGPFAHRRADDFEPDQRLASIRSIVWPGADHANPSRAREVGRTSRHLIAARRKHGSGPVARPGRALAHTLVTSASMLARCG